MAQNTLLQDLVEYNTLRKLRDGYLPLEHTEKETYARHLACTEQALERCDTEIAKLAEELERLEPGPTDQTPKHTHTRLTSLKGERDSYRTHFLHLKSLPAPVRRLPRDILVEIFTHFSGWIVLRKVLHITIPLLDICHISSTWRSIALSEGSFWNHIRVDREEPRELIDWILQNSGNSPLFLDIMPNSDVTTFVGLSHRFQHLDVRCNPSSYLLLRPIRHNLGSMESCGINFSAGTFENLQSIFDDTPCLKNVRLSLQPYQWSEPSLGRETLSRLLPWKQLESLEIERVDITAFLDIISQCGNLKALTLSVVFRDCPEGPTMALNGIETLNIHLDFHCPRTRLRSIFKRFTFPSLKYLTIYTAGADIAQDTATSFLDMQKSSSFLLSSLTIKDLDGDTFMIFRYILYHLPSLQTFEVSLDAPSIMHDFISRLTLHEIKLDQPSEVDVPLLPNLESITIKSYAETYDMESTELLQMVKSRFSVGGDGSQDSIPRTLKRAKFEAYSVLDKDVEEEFERLRTMGLDFTYRVTHLVHDGNLFDD